MKLLKAVKLSWNDMLASQQNIADKLQQICQI